MHLMNLIYKCIQEFNFSYTCYVECVLDSRECYLYFFIVSDVVRLHHSAWKIIPNMAAVDF